MSQTQTNENNNRFNPQLGDIEQAQKKLVELKDELRSKNIMDPNGSLIRKANELEGLYKEIKSDVKQTLASGQKAFELKKAGFLSGWQDLKRATEQAKDNLKSFTKE